MVARADLEVVLRATDRATPTIQNLESSIIRFVGAVSAALAGLTAIAFPIAQAATFERELKNVQKTTGFLDDEIKLLADDLVDLSRNLTDSATDLAAIAAIAGQLGIRGRNNIVAFTASISRAATALDLTAENAAIAGARILNIFQLDVSQLENVLSTINELSNTTTANASQLIDVIARIGPIAGLQIQQVAALGATAIDLGVSPEVAGTSLVKVFSRIQAEAGKFAEALGIEIGDFIALGAEERFRTFLDFLAKQSEVTRAELTRTLAGSGRIFALVNKFVDDANVGFVQFNRNIVTANESFIEGTSAIREYENVSSALLNRLLNLRNNFVALSLEVGGNLIPDLIDATERLNEFLQSDRAKAFAAAVGQAFKDLVEGGLNFLEFLTSLDFSFQNLIATVRVFIAFKIAQVFVGIGIRIVSATKALVLFELAMIGAQRAQAIFAKTTVAASAATALATARAARLAGTITKVVGVLSTGLRIAFPIVGLIVAGIGAALLLSQDLFSGIASFFGFVSKEDSKLSAERQANLNELRKAAGEAAVEFRQVSQQAAEGAFAAPADFEINLDAGIEEFQKNALAAGSAISTLVDGLAAAEDHVTNIAEREADIRLEIERLVAENENLLDVELKLLDTQESFGVVLALDGIEQAKQLGDLETKVELNEASLVALRASADALREVGELAVKAQEALRKGLQGTADTLTTTFSGPQLAFVSFTASLKLAERQTVELTKEGGELADQLVRQGNAILDAKNDLEGTPEELAKLAKASATTGEALKKNNAELEIAKERIEIFGDAAQKTANQIGPVATALTQPLIDGLDKLNNEQLEATPKRFNLLRDSAGKTGTAMESTAEQVARLAIDLASLDEEAAALENNVAAQAAKDLAKTAQGVFDNSARSVRAFRSDIIDLKRELETGLEDRVIDLRIRRRASEFDKRIEDAEQRKNDIIEDFQVRIDNARNNAERIYLGRRKDDALEAIKTEIAQVEQERAFLEEKALKDRFERLQERIEGFVTAAKAAAKQGNLDEALGLQDAAKTATKSLGGIISELSELENTDPFGNISFAVTESEIKGLLAEFQATEAGVSEAIPIINRDLKDATKDVAKVFEEAEASIESRLRETNKEIELLAKTVPGLTKILEDIGKVLRRTEAFRRLAAITQTGGLAAGADLGSQITNQQKVARELRISLQDAGTVAGAAIIEAAQRATFTGDATNAGLLVTGLDNLQTLALQEAEAIRDGDEQGAADAKFLIQQTQESIRALRDLIAVEKSGQESLRAQQIRLNDALSRRDDLRTQREQGGGRLPPQETQDLATVNRLIAQLSEATGADPAEIARGRVAVTDPVTLPAIVDVSTPESAAAIQTGGLAFGTTSYAAMVEASKTNPLRAQLVQAELELEAKVDTPNVAAGTGGLTAEDLVAGARRGGFVVRGGITTAGIRGARGGQISGAGSGTSDSIPAMLSNGEYIIDAFTTRMMGSKFFSNLQALARSGRKMRTKLPGFAAGGLVGLNSLEGLTPAIAAAGLGGGSPVNITLPAGGVLNLATGISTVEDIKRVMSSEARKVGRRVRR